jgi:hypothetical protein
VLGLVKIAHPEFLKPYSEQSGARKTMSKTGRKRTMNGRRMRRTRRQ